MKPIFILLCAFLLSLTSFAQSANYKTISDDPADMYNLFLDINAIVDMSVAINEEQVGGILGFGYGLRAAYYPIVKKFGAQINYTSSQDLINSFITKRFEMIGTFTLFSSQKKGDHRLILSETSNGSTTTTESIVVPQTRQNNFEVRGGFLNHSGVIGFVPLSDQLGAIKKPLTFKSTALIAGIQWRKFHSYDALIDNEYIVETSGMFELYGDVLLPLSNSYFQRLGGNLVTPEGLLMTRFEDLGLEAPIGARLGTRYTSKPSKIFSWNGGMETAIFAPSSAIHLYFYGGLSFHLL